ncbi:MAG: acyl-CoA dehydrogenase [Chromatiales bacterium]|nr:acyl-CoA dehydrogenase [Chromatiales bacterium]
MADYRAPVKDMSFVIRELAGLDQVARLPGHEEATPDLVEAVLEEAAQLAGEVIGPTNAVGDAQGTQVVDGEVQVPEEFTSAYRQFVGGGWGAITAEKAFGGQELPFLVGMAVEEMWQSANLAWSLCPLLTQGAVRALQAHADDELKQRYLPKMVSGEWTGTMNLTEPQAGSDLSAVRSQAVPDGDHYRVTGQKIFITWGDHTMADNVIHLVLARLPDAPAGVRGISLFLVPKFLLDGAGVPGERNAVRPVSVEHKLGIHGSPTCVMAFENARGWLVGEPNRGLAAMFTMMNHARIGVGLEGLAVAERAYQQSLAWARDRVQGFDPGGRERVAIIRHPDVRRMLLTMRACIGAMRANAYTTGAQLDFAHRAADPGQRAQAQARVDLMTPVIKGWCTEIAQQLTSLAVQVHGGMGYVEETGVAQHFRDARITTIYEGTTGIQANDLVGRKILRDGGQAMEALLAEMRGLEPALADAGPQLAPILAAHKAGCDALEQSVTWLLEHHSGSPTLPGAVAHSLLMLMGTVTGGWQLARSALRAAERLGQGESADAAWLQARIVTARFYAEQLMPPAVALLEAIKAGDEALMALPDEAW